MGEVKLVALSWKQISKVESQNVAFFFEKSLKTPNLNAIT